MSISRLGGKAVLEVSDEGPGLPVGLDPKAAKTAGLRLVAMLAGQIDGDLEFLPGPGTRVRVAFDIGQERQTVSPWI